MSGIKIPIEAVFNSAGAQQGLDAVTGAAERAGDAASGAGNVIDKVVDAAGKAEGAIDKVTGAAGEAAKAVGQVGAALSKTGVQKLSPVEKEAIKNVRDLEAAVNSYFRVAGAAGKRRKASGQEGKRFEDIDWHLMYPGDPARAQKTRQAALNYAVNHVQPAVPSAAPGTAPAQPAHAPAAPPPVPPPTPRGKTHAGRIVGAGLNAAGPAGGVANSAIGAGMSGGLVAGLAGLAGGLAALGVGKVVGAVADKVGAAQREDVGYDTLKRTLGDVNVGFNMLRQSLQAASYSIDVGFDEGQRLATQFARGSGMGAGRAGELAGEVSAAGGFSRSFGLDPGQGAAFFAQQRANGVTTDERGSRRLAMMIGEAIAKSDAFSKADDVLEAIAGYTAAQARAGMNAANVEGFASMLTGMVAAKRPGMDPAGSAALLGRMNAAVIGGGAAGEAGQNFMFSALSRTNPGMDPVDAAILQQQGLFGTRRKAFGAGSAYAEFMGKDGLKLGGVGADDDKTNLQSFMEQFQRVYGGRGPQMKKLMANAMGNLFGLNETQAMAVASIRGPALGSMGNRLDRLGIDMKSVNASGISKMAQIEADGSLSDFEKDRQMRAAASAGQEATLGSDVRKTTTAVENIEQEIAGKLVPLTNEMRNGIMYIAGRGQMSTRQIQEEVARGDSKDRASTIGAQYDARLDAAYKDREKAKAAMREGVLLNGYDRLNMSPEEKERRQAAAKARRLEEERTEAVVEKLQAEKAAALKKEADRLDAEIAEIGKAAADRLKKEEEVKAERARIANGTGAGGGRGSVNPANGATGASSEGTRAYLAATDRMIGAPEGTSEAQIGVESSWNPGARSHRGARGIAQIMPATQAALEKRLGRTLDPHNETDALIMHREVMVENTRQFGNYRDGLRAYNGGWNPATWGNRETSSYVPKIDARRARAEAGTPLPEGAPAATGVQRHDVTGRAEVSIIHQDARGQVIAPAQNIAVRLAPARPVGS